ncbi:MAG: carboxymuconolactone decarboxylase family protein [Planctomycetota bacterium]|jgi:AhpD family alkylhydroperoxidase
MRVSISPEQVRKAFEPVKDRPDFQESRGLVERGTMPVEMIQAMALRPDILAAFGYFGSCVYPDGLLERSIKEFVIIAASRANACQFCRDSHVAVARMLGLSDDPLRALEDPEGLSLRERLAVEYTQAAMTDSNRVPDELFERLRDHFSDPEIVELTFTIGFINMLNLFNNCLQVTYHGEYEALQKEKESGVRS